MKTSVNNMQVYQDLEKHKEQQLEDELIKRHVEEKFGKPVPEQYQDLEELNAKKRNETGKLIRD